VDMGSIVTYVHVHLSYATIKIYVSVLREHPFVTVMNTIFKSIYNTQKLLGLKYELYSDIQRHITKYKNTEEIYAKLVCIDSQNVLPAVQAQDLSAPRAPRAPLEQAHDQEHDQDHDQGQG
jgi:hypothetical protein